MKLIRFHLKSSSIELFRSILFKFILIQFCNSAGVAKLNSEQINIAWNKIILTELIYKHIFFKWNMAKFLFSFSLSRFFLFFIKKIHKQYRIE